jgi:hypothetical protein
VRQLTKDLFLDTCVILSQVYGPVINDHYKDTFRVMNGPLPLFSTTTVVTEARSVLRRRSRFMGQLDEVFKAGFNYSQMRKNGATDNDVKHFMKVEAILRNIGRDKAIEIFKHLSLGLRVSLDDQLNLIKGGIYNGPCGDHCTFMDFQKTGLPEVDAQIVTDFFDWGKTRTPGPCWLVSLDGHMTNNCGKIRNVMTNHPDGPINHMDVVHATKV